MNDNYKHLMKVVWDNKMRQELIKYANNISEDEQIEFIRDSHYRIGFIINPSERVQVESIRYNINCIHYIDNLCEAAQMELVRVWDYRYEMGDFALGKIKSKRVMELYEKLRKVNKVIK